MWCRFEYELIGCFVDIALDFREWLGGEVRINAYCRDLAIRGGEKLAEILGTEYLDGTLNHELTSNMVRNHLRQPEVTKNCAEGRN